MAINKKRRRPFVFRDRKFLWDANDEWTLRIASVDKKFSISLPAIFPPWPPYSDWPQDRIPIYVAGPEFPGLDGKKDVWIVCRRFGVEQITTTPGFVASLLEWCFDPTKQVELLEEART